MKCGVKIYSVIFILGFLLSHSSFAESFNVPELPAQYYGKVISPTPLNGSIEAKIDNETYATIPLVNNAFGGPTYLDGKLLVYAPGKKDKEVKFYLNGTILLNASDTIKYKAGDVRFIKLYYNINTTKLKILKEIVVLDEENITDIIDINNVSTYNISNLEVVEIPLESIGDTVIIPKVVNVTLKIKNITKIIENLNKTLNVADKIKNVEIRNESDVKEIVEKIAENITPVIAVNFTIANETVEESEKVGNKIISTISFNAVNTSKKGFITVRVPIGNLTVENVTVSNGTTTVELNEWKGNNTHNKIGWYIGWYRIPTEGVLEITLIKDPKVKVTLSAELPPKKTPTYIPTGGGAGPSPITKVVAKDIKSEKIRDFVYRTRVAVGSEIDINLSAKYLKTDIDLIDTPFEIKEDCILIGGPVANPVVKKYLNYFPVRVTNEYPGRYKGVIEVIKIDGHTVVLLAGSDRWGTKAAVEYFKTLEDLPDEPIFVEWRNGKAVKIERP
ncbi:hypothetical protein CFE53_02575 [Methanofervidicoccus sp. A16]|uniref:S-layer protein n=1 Tax=Methanofervidicoccus sp. A16 TaxID=2607662 RepID=UPI001188E722|nr:S-layer protein [Methanofervidicoccus sp. A16]AXI25097.1 hypothetical protein CFE53_02575 [Methanofervidicoccus sp. A16]